MTEICQVENMFTMRLLTNGASTSSNTMFSFERVSVNKIYLNVPPNPIHHPEDFLVP